MLHLQKIEIRGQRYLSTPQLAEAYGTSRKLISYNFQYNKKRFIEGKHYVRIEGEALRQLKGCLEFPDTLKYASHINLWTEKGALLHAKSLNTDKAWEVYDWLVDFYFRVKENKPMIQTTSPVQKPVRPPEMVLDIPNNKQIQSKIQEIKAHCISVMTLLDAQNKYLEAEKVKELHGALSAVGCYLYLNIRELSAIKVKEIEQPR